MNGVTSVVSTYPPQAILARVPKKRGRRYYLNDNEIIEQVDYVVGTFKVHGHFEDRKCTRKIDVK